MDSAIAAGKDPVTAGFTLVELLVAVAVLSVLAVGASLVAGRSAPGSGEAARFERSYAAARQLAVTGQRVRGLAITPSGYQPMRLDPAGWTRLGRANRWSGRVAFRPDPPPLPPGWPEIVFLPDGRSNAFSIRLGTGRDGVFCESDGWTGLRCGPG